ncbi:MAG: hypothetical protein M3362_17250, partial [Acidobacteriota bacterium]|nr:hypothetical protein [Acidobacteriota bacterium]
SAAEIIASSREGDRMTRLSIRSGVLSTPFDCRFRISDFGLKRQKAEDSQKHLLYLLPAV